MAVIRPFSAVRYTRRPESDPSDLIAPPYDVLDAAAKAKLVAKSTHNIVTVDLPFMPPKSTGPNAVYDQANRTILAWLGDGILARDRRPALYPYMQTFNQNGRTFHRRGFICLVKLEEFSTAATPTDVIAHEKTHAGPIEDRLNLMRATGMQLSPIFGLYPDPSGEVTKLLYKQVSRPEFDATMDGVKHQLWSVTDSEVERQVIDALRTKKIYIADGHHRYTTALAFKKELEHLTGAALPADHPANFCMFALVSMQDDGCIILPTHRALGGLSDFSVERLANRLGNKWNVERAALDRSAITKFEAALAHDPDHSFGLLDGMTGTLHTLRLIDEDLLKSLEPTHSDAWRRLDVAILHRFLIDEVLMPLFGGGSELKRAYTPDSSTLAKAVDGKNFQVGILLRPTPLKALEELGKTGEVMPQKSTYFFPKLATGVTLNSLT